MDIKRSAGIHAPVSRIFDKAPVDFQRDVDDHKIAVFDPDRPSLGPNELLAEAGGMLDPRTMNHCCPLCKRVMRWEIFSAHLNDCCTDHQKMNRRNFAGATRKA